MKFMEYQHPEQTTQRQVRDDRVFPLETVTIQSFRDTHDAEIDTALIHTGPAADTPELLNKPAAMLTKYAEGFDSFWYVSDDMRKFGISIEAWVRYQQHTLAK